MTSSKGRRRADSSGSTMSAAGSEAGSVGAAVEGNAADLRVLSQLRSLKVSKQELAPPSIAWPTLAVFVVMYAVHWSTVWAAVTGRLSTCYAVPILSATVFVAFTPMHDAVHGSLATHKSGVRWINGFIGRLCALLYTGAFLAFRYIHLKHHKHTNDDDNDPDMWSSRGSPYLRVFRWASQDLHYYAIYFPILSTRPVRERVETWCAVALLTAFISSAVMTGHGWELLLLWALPSRIASTMLAFTFDYLPHRPHKSRDRFEGTNVTSLVAQHTEPLTFPLLYQNYHNIHHLYPYLPFYHYSRLWFAHKDELQALGTKIHPLFPITVASPAPQQTARS